MENKSSRLVINTSYRSRMRISRPVARVLATAYYNLSIYAGCNNKSEREARDVSLERAMFLGGLDADMQLTDLGMRMLVSYVEAKERMMKEGWAK